MADLATLGNIKTHVRARGYETDQDTRIVTFANAVQRSVVGDHRWRFLLGSGTVTAVAGTAVYTLPAASTRMHVESIRLADATGLFPPLKWSDTEDLLDLAAMNPAYTANDSPYLWTDVSPGSFQVYPAPYAAGTFTVRYLRAVADLVNDADVPDIPAPYLDIIVAGVCELLALRERQQDTAAVWRAEKEQRLAAMKGQYGLRQRQTSPTVADSGCHYE